jgi:hypothetical protein
MKSQEALFAARALPSHFSAVFRRKQGGYIPSPSARRSMVGLPSSAKFWSLLLGHTRLEPHRHVRSPYPSSCTEVWSTESAHSVGSQCHGSRPIMIAHPHSFAPINTEKGFLRWGLCPHTPGIYRFTARIAGLVGAAGAAPPCWCALPHSGRWIGAPVASLRCRILRPGPTSIGPYASDANFLVADIGARV